MLILYVFMKGDQLTMCVSSDIDKLKQFPNLEISWMDMSTKDKPIWHGKAPGFNGWFLIERVLQV